MSSDKLTPLQRRILRGLARLEPAWTLAGGAALAVIHLEQRTAGDLDLFWRGRGVLGSLAREAEQTLRSQGLEVAALRTHTVLLRVLGKWLVVRDEGGTRGEICLRPRWLFRMVAQLFVDPVMTFHRLRVGDEQDVCILDLAAPRVSAVRDPIRLDLGGVPILVDSPQDILVDKLQALLHRSEAKDLTDVKALVERGIDLNRALADARGRPGFSAPALAGVLKGFEPRALAREQGLGDVETEAIVRFHRSLVERLVAPGAPRNSSPTPGILSVALATAWRSLREIGRYPLSGAFRALAVLYLFEYVSRMALLELRVERGSSPTVTGPERLTIVVPVYDRLANVRPIVRSALRLPFLERIVIVNANPRVRIADLLSPPDPRVIAVDDPGSGVGVRFSAALDHPSDYYLTFDDDMILRPDQMARMFRILVAEPEVTHGILGVRYTGARGRPFEFGIRGREAEVDLLNGLHAFTRSHLERYHRTLRAAGLPASREIHNGEDIVMSLAGSGRPRVHAVGRWIQCPSTIDPDVALHLRRPSFAAERLEMFLRLRSILGSTDASGPDSVHSRPRP